MGSGRSSHTGSLQSRSAVALRIGIHGLPRLPAEQVDEVAVLLAQPLPGSGVLGVVRVAAGLGAQCCPEPLTALQVEIT
jgi:hypothetical protein